MCLTLPGKIQSIDSGIAVVRNGNKTAQVDLSLVFDAKPGDWILYATNRAVKKISATDAKEILALLEDFYHPVDVDALPLKLKKIIFKVRSGKNSLRKAEIMYLLKLKGQENLETLFAEANFLRKERIDDFICIHGIIEFSNYCQNNCLYCGIRRDNKLPRYRMSKAEILQVAYKAVSEGYKLLVLQSGEDHFFSDTDLLDIIASIKREMRVFVFLSVGERSIDFYNKAYQAGATGALIRYEITNQKLFEKMRPNHKLADRLTLIKKLKKIGYYVATGSLFGLPGQSVEDIADDLITLKKLNPPMISAGPFIEAAGTPLSKTKNQKPKTKSKDRIELALKYIAIARFLLPEAKIPVTTALETLDNANGRHRALLAGANSLMFNLTPEKYAKNYSIYDRKYIDREKIWQKYGLFTGEESWEMLEERMKVEREK